MLVVRPSSGRRPRWWIEALVLLWLLWAYDAISNLQSLRLHAAMSHARDVLDFEKSVHLDPEHALQSLLIGHRWLDTIAGNYYTNAHFIVTFGVLAWLWVRRPDQYRPMRTALAVCNVIGFAVYRFWPMAPPRLLIGAHYTDIVAVSHYVFEGWSSSGISKDANQFASMPSLHLAWAVWSACAVFYVLHRRTRWAWAAWIYPLLTLLVVLATANHFFIDCVAGTLTLAISAWIGITAERWRKGRLSTPPEVASDTASGREKPQLPEPVGSPLAGSGTDSHR